MPINLQKGQTISLEKDTNDLSQITIGLGWKIRKKGFFAKLSGAQDYDLDAIAFVLDEHGKVRSLGDKLMGSDVIFFGNLRHPSGQIYHSGDNRVGGSGDNDDEQIVVRLNTLPANVHRILFLVQIYQGKRHNQHFGEVESAYMRAIDAKNQEMARYNLTSEPLYNGKCIMVFGEVYRQGGGWKFRALGEGHATDNFVEILKSHV
ncbi:stress response protein SCP2 [Roseimicrobium gellanilyticum]|uniref:Stress response protein SCP2 n=1 Tax=Roseimicrobium gellanilyticum TaxID=748857 RepID=A0A366HQY7_9BACT|nr:TerD family protein [Roseimicrobium gellanilyticum]RBP44614.1 stress response protein SCP2 [Roseimicrobium gellanilyticum]